MICAVRLCNGDTNIIYNTLCLKKSYFVVSDVKIFHWRYQRKKKFTPIDGVITWQLCYHVSSMKLWHSLQNNETLLKKSIIDFFYNYADNRPILVITCIVDYLTKPFGAMFFCTILIIDHYHWTAATSIFSELRMTSL